MELVIYKEAVKRTLPDLGLNKEQTERVESIETGLKLNLCHMTMGLSSEVSELIECIGGTNLSFKVDKVNLIEELGDVCWYNTNYCNFREIALPAEPVFVKSDDECLELLIDSVGRLCNIVKRHIAYGASLDRLKEMEATYDIQLSVHMFARLYQLDMSDIRKRNIQKLSVRYPDKFSDVLALNRDVNGERRTLEAGH